MAGLFMIQPMLKAQIPDTLSPYVNNGAYSIVSDSITVSSKKVLIYRPDAVPEENNKYPVLIFHPGANALFSSAITVHTYDLFMKHLATYGYVVFVIDETSAGMPSGTTIEAVHDWFKTNVANSSSWVYTYADSSKVLVGGHSLGGVDATSCIVDRPNQIKGIVYFASYPSNNILLPQNVSSFKGKVLDLSGADDASSTPATCRTGYDSFTSANCAFWVSISGLNHGGFGDYVDTSQPVGPIGRKDATAIIRHYLVSFMESQFKNNNVALANFENPALQPDSTADFENSCSVTAIDEENYSEENILFPNPAKDLITLKTKFDNKISNIVITDITGRNITTLIKIEEKNSKEFIFDISSLNSGNYFICFTGKKSKPDKFTIIK